MGLLVRTRNGVPVSRRRRMNLSAPGTRSPSYTRTPSMSVSQLVTGVVSVMFVLWDGAAVTPLSGPTVSQVLSSSDASYPGKSLPLVSDLDGLADQPFRQLREEERGG